MGGAWIFPTVIAGMLALLVAVIGMTITDIGPWYHALVQPGWAPPDVVYGYAWTFIYATAAIAGVNAWLAMPRRVDREWLIGLYALNGFLNVMWSVLFFQFHRPDWALFEVVGLWLSVLGLILQVWPHSGRAALWLAPYLAWVSFAAYLNLMVVRLNGPFS